MSKGMCPRCHCFQCIRQCELPPTHPQFAVGDIKGDYLGVLQMT